MQQMKRLRGFLALCCVFCLTLSFGGCRKKQEQYATNTDSMETLGTIVEHGEEADEQPSTDEAQGEQQGSRGETGTTAGQPQANQSGGGKQPAAPVTTVKQTNTTAKAQQYTCMLTIQCKALLSNMDKLPEGKRKLVPSSGVLYHKSLSFKEGETAYDVLKRSGVRVDASYTPGYGSIYIKGIGNIYEKDCGGTSGWMFAVNGSLPGYGSNKYKLKNGDRVEFFYTC